MGRCAKQPQSRPGTRPGRTGAAQQQGEPHAQIANAYPERLFTCPADNRTKNGGRACPDPEIGRHHVTRGELVNISPNVTAAWLDWGAVVARDLGASPLAGPRRGVTGHTARDARLLDDLQLLSPPTPPGAAPIT